MYRVNKKTGLIEKKGVAEELYAEYDDEDNVYYVYGVDSGKAYMSFTGEEEAEEAAISRMIDYGVPGYEKYDDYEDYKNKTYVH